MPWIIVAAEEQAQDRNTALLRERVNVADFESDHFSAQLVERLGWAVLDADEREHDRPAEPERAPARRERPHAQAPRRREPVGA